MNKKYGFAALVDVSALNKTQTQRFLEAWNILKGTTLIYSSLKNAAPANYRITFTSTWDSHAATQVIPVAARVLQNLVSAVDLSELIHINSQMQVWLDGKVVISADLPHAIELRNQIMNP